MGWRVVWLGSAEGVFGVGGAAAGEPLGIQAERVVVTGTGHNRPAAYLGIGDFIG